MPAQPYVNGPSHVWVGLPAQSPLYLGITKITPVIKVRRHHEPVWNSIAGVKVPLELAYQGKEGMLAFDFTVYDEAVLQFVQSYPAASRQVAGRDVFGTLGTLPILEGEAFRVWVGSPYAVLKPAMNRLGPGYRFMACSLVDDEDFGPLNTTAKSVQVVFHALPIFINTNGDQQLYDFNMDGLPDPTFGTV